MDTPPTETTAESFGRLVTELAIAAGYDMSPGSSGRGRLAADTGMSVSAVGRMVNGKTLPKPNQIEHIARAVRTTTQHLLQAAGVISDGDWPEGGIPDVLSVTSQSPLTPQAAADAWGITDPMIRAMLIANIEHALRLQREVTGQAAASTGGL
ncbi:multiprotein-bridging factor 1 family protein [Streptomyces sp. NPDC127037]|uniref:helix-turn-helix domain-containing protein n=1 Tax=Streptomyces sp. NPDC127037 TaxID=3347113 RepID=UPI003647B7ED